MPTFQEPNDKMKSAFDKMRALSCHHDRLAEVSIKVLAAYATRNKDDEPRGEALARDGDPILGKIRIMSLEDRSDGSADVRVLLHGDRWGELSAAMQRSVIDTCLMRIEVMQEDGKPKLDDLGRPKLRKCKWGFQFCGFNEVAKRHGKSSLEVHNFRVFFDEHGQTYLPWFEDDEPPAKILQPAPKARRAPALGPGDGEHARGPLSSKALCEHLQHLDQPATVLGVAKLELQHNPRKAVIAAVKDRVLKMTILVGYIAIEKGDDADVEIDLAAAVLVTTPKPSIDLLDRMVPDCLDPTVLGWVLEGEGEESPREAVLEVVNRRIRELAK